MHTYNIRAWTDKKTFGCQTLHVDSMIVELYDMLQNKDQYTNAHGTACTQTSSYFDARDLHYTVYRYDCCWYDEDNGYLVVFQLYLDVKTESA